VDWLCAAFGFEVRLEVEGDGGVIEHSELLFGEAVVMVGDERRQKSFGPSSPLNNGSVGSVVERARSPRPRTEEM
jgi:uncharacterized glyoxalase superfamily protein PhnB